MIFASAYDAITSKMALELSVISSSIFVLLVVLCIRDRSLLSGEISIPVASLSVRNACKQPDSGPQSFLTNDWIVVGPIAKAHRDRFEHFLGSACAA